VQSSITYCRCIDVGGRSWDDQSRGLGCSHKYWRKGLPAGSSLCNSLGTNFLKDEEVGISATDWNLKRRMGWREALAYLASPEVVAASAMKGFIAGLGDYTGSSSVVSISSPPPAPS